MAVLCEYNDRDVSFHHSVDQAPHDTDFKMHLHENNEILFFVSGDAHFLIEGNDYALSAGDVVLMRDSESHKIKIISSEPYERYVVNFPSEAVLLADPSGELLKAFRERPMGLQNIYHLSEFSGHDPVLLFRMMCNENEPDSHLSLICNLMPLLNELRRCYLQRMDSKLYSSPDCFTADDSAAIVAYVNDRLFDRELSLSMVCDRFYISTSQLCRRFKQATGTGLWDYVLIKRLLAARALIKRGMPPGKASAECGFSNYSSFYRGYIRKFKEPPGSIRN